MQDAVQQKQCHVQYKFSQRPNIVIKEGSPLPQSKNIELDKNKVCQQKTDKVGNLHQSATKCQHKAEARIQMDSSTMVSQEKKKKKKRTPTL